MAVRALERLLLSPLSSAFPQIPSLLFRNSPVQLQYLADRNPSTGLAPAAGTNERYLLQAHLSYVSSEIHKAVGAFFNPKTKEEGPLREYSLANLEAKFKFLETRLTGKSFLDGKKLSVADM